MIPMIMILICNFLNWQTYSQSSAFSFFFASYQRSCSQICTRLSFLTSLLLQKARIHCWSPRIGRQIFFYNHMGEWGRKSLDYCLPACDSFCYPLTYNARILQNRQHIMSYRIQYSLFMYKTPIPAMSMLYLGINGCKHSQFFLFPCFFYHNILFSTFGTKMPHQHPQTTPLLQMSLVFLENNWVISIHNSFLFPYFLP